MLWTVEELHYFVIYYTKYTLATTVIHKNKTKSPFAAKGFVSPLHLISMLNITEELVHGKFVKLSLAKLPQQSSCLITAQLLFCHCRAVIIACLDILWPQTSKKIAFAWLMHVTCAESGESMSYFSPGSSNKSTWASTHSSAFSSSSSSRGSHVCVCRQGPGAKHLINGCLRFTTSARQHKVLLRQKSWSCILPNPLEHLCPCSPMRYCLVEPGKRQTGVGLQGWKFKEQVAAINKSAAHLSAEKINSERSSG